MVQIPERTGEQWRQKYLDKLDQLDRKEKEWAGIEAVLKRAVGRLSVAAIGYNKTVDRHIEELRVAIRDDLRLYRLEMIIDDLSCALSKTATEQTIIPLLQKLITGLELPKNCEKDREALLKRLARERDEAGETIVSEILTLLHTAVTCDKPEHPVNLQAAPTEFITLPRHGKDTGEDHMTAAEFVIEVNRHVDWPDKMRNRSRQIETGLKRDDSPQALISEYASLINRLITIGSSSSRLTAIPSTDTSLSEDLPAMVVQRETVETEAGMSQPVPEDSNSGSGLRELLSSLFEQLAMPESLEQQVTDLKQRLELQVDTADWIPLLKDIASLVSTVRNRIQQERQEFEVFLQQITSRLQDMDRYLKNEADSLSTARQESLSFDNSVRSHVDDIRGDIKTVTDLDALKISVEKRLDTIAEDIMHYRQTEQRRYDIAKRDIHNMQQQMHIMQKQTEKLNKVIAEKSREALYDVLTGLPNRLAYEKRMEIEIARWKRFNEPLSLVICDIDHFKRVNDAYGHNAGDKALKSVGKLLGKRLRETDFLARIGGEEFVILLPGTTDNDALYVLEEIRERVSSSGFHYRGKAVNITVSFGVSAFHDGDSLSDVFERADRALYSAKENGRNRVQLAA